jgi:2-oxoglutarate ferredoxin oxidoreductase subunit beta
LAVAAGAPFVARGTVYHAQLLDDLFKKAILKCGFSVVEVLSNCHVHFGRQNAMGDPMTMMRWFRDRAVNIENTPDMAPDSMEDKFTIGILTDVEKPAYMKEYERVREKSRD